MSECLECLAPIDPNDINRKRCVECALIFRKRDYIEKRRAKNAAKFGWDKPKECPYCHNMFDDDRTGISGMFKTYCSEMCRTKNHNEKSKKIVTCVTCLTPIDGVYRRDCESCKNKKETLRDKIKQESIERAKNKKCNGCGILLGPSKNKQFCAPCKLTRRRAQGRKYVYQREQRKKGQIVSVEDQIDPAELNKLLSSSNICSYCEQEAEIMTFDHVIPLSEGGLHHMSNIVLACKSCNSSKQALTVEEWATSGRKGVPDALKEKYLGATTKQV